MQCLQSGNLIAIIDLLDYDIFVSELLSIFWYIKTKIIESERNVGLERPYVLLAILLRLS